MENKPRYQPSLCVTHNCNLNCIYCYQKHDQQAMNLETAKKVINQIIETIPQECEGISIGFIGGEPMLEFNLVKEICEYTWQTFDKQDIKFFASTNGTIMTSEMKEWFLKNCNKISLGISLDGTKDTHNYNRSNSYDKIDIKFFHHTWPNEGVKMALSEYSLYNLAENIIHIHKLGFDVQGANLAEGDFTWNEEKLIPIVSRELKKLVDFYIMNPEIKECQMLDKNLSFCELQDKPKDKYCGIGYGANFFDINGKMYGCPYTTPMTFSEDELQKIMQTDFSNEENFIDEYCYNNCYLYNVCPTCAGANFKENGSFKIRDKRKCKIQKLIALYTAELQSKKIIAGIVHYDEDRLFYTIEAIKKIRKLYLPEFENLISE